MEPRGPDKAAQLRPVDPPPPPPLLPFLRSALYFPGSKKCLFQLESVCRDLVLTSPTRSHTEAST